jgi:hypothetical protein
LFLIRDKCVTLWDAGHAKGAARGMKKAISRPQLAPSKSKPGRALSTQRSAVGEKQEPEATPEKRKRTRQGKFTLKDLSYPDQRVVRFPMVQGKETDTVELLTSKHLHYITVEFADRTSLSFMIEPAFTFTAAYEYLEKGKPRAKMWEEIKSRG